MEAAVLKNYESAPELGEFEEPRADGRALVEVPDGVADGLAVSFGIAGLAERFKEAAGGGFDVVVDPLWGEPAMAALTALSVEGRLIQVGNSAGESAHLPTRGFRNQLGRIVGHTNFKASRELKREAFAAMCRHAIAGELRVETEGLPLRDVGEAWGRKSPHRKLVIEISPTPGVERGVDAEAEAAAAEAAHIGGRVDPLSDDPAREPLEEAGEGEAEGFEQAERRLADIAAHGDQHRFPDRDAPDPEDREDVERGEPDQPIPADE